MRSHREHLVGGSQPCGPMCFADIMPDETPSGLRHHLQARGNAADRAGKKHWMPDIEWILDVVEAGWVVVSALVYRDRAAVDDGSGAVASVLIFDFTFIVDIKAGKVTGVPMTGFQFDDIECPCIHFAAATDFHAHADHTFGVDVEGLGIEGALFVF